MSMFDFILSIIAIPSFFGIFVFIPIILIDRLLEREVCDCSEDENK